MGWLSRFEFAGTAGWALTDAGRAANERQLAEELAQTDSASSVRDAYAAFLTHNGPAPPGLYGLAAAAHRGRPARGE